MNRVIFSLLLAAVAFGAAPAHAAMELKSVSIELPDSTRMYEGANSDAINNNCLSCHSVGMVMNQPNMTKAAWEGEVNKMIKTYKAPIAESDVSAIVDYLVSVKGAQ